MGRLQDHAIAGKNAIAVAQLRTKQQLYQKMIGQDQQVAGLSGQRAARTVDRTSGAGVDLDLRIGGNEAVNGLFDLTLDHAGMKNVQSFHLSASQRSINSIIRSFPADYAFATELYKNSHIFRASSR